MEADPLSGPLVAPQRDLRGFRVWGLHSTAVVVVVLPTVQLVSNECTMSELFALQQPGHGCCGMAAEELRRLVEP